MNNTPYWLCCGSTDPLHKDKRASLCVEAKLGYINHCKFETIKEHKESMDKEKEDAGKE